eukprot:8967498-Alexandrium_andersonii.AAC.1
MQEVAGVPPDLPNVYTDGSVRHPMREDLRHGAAAMWVHGDLMLCHGVREHMATCPLWTNPNNTSDVGT